MAARTHDVKEHEMPATNMFSCRLSDSDRTELAAKAADLGVSKSQCLRYLVRLPLGEKDGTRCVVIDNSTLSTVSRELVKWGRHYNQAVHAMNTIQMFIVRERLDAEYFAKTIAEIDESLELIEGGRRELAYVVERIGSSVAIDGK